MECRFDDRHDLPRPQEVAEPLNEFFAYVEPNIEGVEQAIDVLNARAGTAQRPGREGQKERQPG